MLGVLALVIRSGWQLYVFFFSSSVPCPKAPVANFTGGHTAAVSENRQLYTGCKVRSGDA